MGIPLPIPGLSPHLERGRAWISTDPEVPCVPLSECACVWESCWSPSSPRLLGPQEGKGPPGYFKSLFEYSPSSCCGPGGSSLMIWCLEASQILPFPSSYTLPPLCPSLFLEQASLFPSYGLCISDSLSWNSPPQLLTWLAPPHLLGLSSSSPPQRSLPESLHSISTHSWDSAAVISAHLFPSRLFSPFVLLRVSLAVVCAIHYHVQPCEPGTSDLAFLPTVSPASDPSTQSVPQNYF